MMKVVKYLYKIYYGDEVVYFGRTKTLEYYCNNIDKYEVIPETVGQFTRLTDKNGKRIFEGDAIKARHNINTYKVCFSECRFFIEDCYGNVIKMHQEAIDRFDCEVVGSIHEEVG